ncbi:MAG: NADH-quinone oxidoreductase subunit H, partial [Dehalococcoidia bacterium]
SAMKFGMFYLAEYINLIMVSALIVTLFLGGWQIPFLARLGIPESVGAALGVLAFALKVGFFLFLFIWVRWTLPRFRYDRLMALGWKVFVPMGLINVALTGLGIVLLG